MAQCDLCGKSAGLLRTRHSACESKAEDLKKSLRELVFSRTVAGSTAAELSLEAERAITESQLPKAIFNETLYQAADNAALKTAVQAPVSDDEFTRLYGILDHFGFDQYKGQLVKRKWYGMVALGMSSTLWHVLTDGKPYYDGSNRMQFNLQRGEQPIFSTGRVVYAEEKTVNTGSRNYGGLSVPIGAGCYYHVGASQGHTVSGLMPMDEGEVLITNRTLYFGGQKRTLRISLASVLRYQPYVDGVGVCESYGAPKVFVPDYSGMDTGWFFFNLLSAITAKLNQG